MVSSSNKRQRGCTHLGALRERQAQLQHSLLRHCAARQEAGLPPLPLGDGWLCLGCGGAAASRSEHAFAAPKQRPGCTGQEPLLDLRRAELYCPACEDYVFDRQFDLALQVAMAAPAGGAAAQGAVTGADDAPGSAAARRCSSGGGEGAATGEAARALAEAFTPVAPDGFPAGLRGLNNLGNTCFMNSVLQALLHAPLLRNHYLLNRHSRAACPIAADGGFCINCELEGVFSAAYSGRRAGFSPAQFLHSWWMLAGGGMAGYQQHDAHEFFCFVLEMMGATTPGADCISRTVFGGTLRSDVICSSCGHTSTSHEQFSHLSLDVPPPQQLIAPTILARPTGGSQATGGAAAGGAAAKAKAGSSKTGAVSNGGGGWGGKRSGGASSRPAGAPAAAGGKAGKLVGAAKVSHERALARKAAEEAATACGSDASAVSLPGAAAPGAAPRAQPQQQAGQLSVAVKREQTPDASGQGVQGLDDSEPEMIDLSDSMSLGASAGGAGGLPWQSGLEAASGVHMGGAALTVDDDAMDTLSSPRQQLIGVLPDMLQRAASGLAGAVGSLWPAYSQPDAAERQQAAQQPAPAQQQQQLQAGRPGGPAGRPPIPPGARAGRSGVAAGVPAGRRGSGSSATQVPHAQRGQDSGSPDPDLTLPDAYGLSTAAGTAMQDSLAAASNLPGSQDAAAAATGAAAAALPPQLAGFYRWPGASLLGCLNRFTRAEQLGASEKWVCDRCASGRHAVKQLSLRRLPPLLVFHAKRFEHAGGLRAVAKKLDTYLSFPLRDLDMRPYLASTVLRSRFRLAPPPPPLQVQGGGEGGAARRTRSGVGAGSRRGSGNLDSPPAASLRRQQQGGAQAPPSDADAEEDAAALVALAADPGACLYDLYAVVCHRGSFQGGHYVAYIKAADQRWYLCDDAWVTAADEEAVRNCQAYMLFYSQRRLLEAREPAAAASDRQTRSQAARRK